MKQFPIKALRGIETKVDGTDQDRGSLRQAEGIVIAPQDAISTAPKWGVAWGFSGLVASMATALTGATAGLVDFVTIADAAGNKLLLAWDLSTTSARGLWVVASGTSAPDFASTSAGTITATNSTPYRDKTAALPWYGTWIGQRLFLGNGTDLNNVWASGALAQLGPSSLPTDLSDPSKYRFPPCKAFAMGPNGVIYAGGNATYPLRLYASDPPTVPYPTISGLLTNDRSFTDLNRYAPQGSAITALTPTATGCLVHLSNGGVINIYGKERSTDGNLTIQGPLANVNGAANQASVATNGFTGSTYLGADLELYTATAQRGEYDVKEPRDEQILTWKASGQWNRQTYRGTNAAVQPYVLEDVLNGRVWLGTVMTLGTAPGLYVFARKGASITGPMRYPRLSCVAPLLRQDLSGAASPVANGSPFVTVGVSTAGVLMYADLGLVGETATLTFDRITRDGQLRLTRNDNYQRIIRS